MIAKLQRVKKAAANESLVLATSSREAPMVAERVDCRVLLLHDPSGRRLKEPSYSGKCDCVDRDHCHDPLGLFLERIMSAWAHTTFAFV